MDTKGRPQATLCTATIRSLWTRVLNTSPNAPASRAASTISRSVDTEQIDSGAAGTVTNSLVTAIPLSSGLFENENRTTATHTRRSKRRCHVRALDPRNDDRPQRHALRPGLSAESHKKDTATPNRAASRFRGVSSGSETQPKTADVSGRWRSHPFGLHDETLGRLADVGERKARD
jgi:hypothetical protein